MSALLAGFHPSFESLSAHADLCDLDAARTRVGRHVARCAACAETVAGIRALGDAARGIELPGAPEGLWTRVEHAQADTALASPGRAVPPSQPPRERAVRTRRGVRRAAPWLAAAAAAVALLLYPIDRGTRLQAAAPQDIWRFSPANPVPGSEVAVRFEPAATHDPKSATLLLLGGIVRRWDADVVSPLAHGRFQDSLAVMVRGSDGAYTGRFILTDTARALVLRLAERGGTVPRRYMSPSGPVSASHEAVALLVSADATGRPSLPALETAVDLWLGSATESYRVADTLVKYYPAEPMGYAARSPVPSHRLLDDVVAWFRNGEREYLKFDRRYLAEQRPSAEHELAMIRFARRIDEPGEERKWTMRLVRDHGDDPRTLYTYGAMLHGMLDRPGTSDSVRRDLPLADSLWERNGHRAGEALVGEAAGAVHDSLAARRWAVRGVLAGARDWTGQFAGVDRWLLTEPGARKQLEVRTRARLAEGCALPAGRYPVYESLEHWRAACENTRAMAYGTLADVALLDGRPAAALALADSGAPLLTGFARCWHGTPFRQRGLAKLALGDTTGAAADLASAATGTSWQQLAYRDSVGGALRPAIPTERWNAMVARAADASLACRREVETRNREAARR